MPLLLWYALLALSPTGHSATGLLAGAALAVAAVLAVAIAVRLHRSPVHRGAGVHVRTTALRERARRTGVLRQRDPDAAGRPRPRAPGRELSAA